MNLIKETIQGDRWFGKIFDYIIQALIFLSLILLAVETLPDLTAKQKRCSRFYRTCDCSCF